MGAVHRGDVVGAGVVEHRVPVRELLHPAGADVQGAHGVAEQQRHHGRHAALQQRRQVLQHRAGAAGQRTRSLPLCQLQGKSKHPLERGGLARAEPSAELKSAECGNSFTI